MQEKLLTGNTNKSPKLKKKKCLPLFPFPSQPLCEDEGRPAGGAEAAGGQDPAGRGAAEGAEGEPGAGAGDRDGNVDGIRTLLKRKTALKR